MRVISSPSRSTTGLATLILAMRSPDGNDGRCGAVTKARDRAARYRRSPARGRNPLLRRDERGAPPSPCVILDTPQLAENIGAVARVMANFGLADLRLVRPRDGWPQERAWAERLGRRLAARQRPGVRHHRRGHRRPAPGLCDHRPAPRGARCRSSPRARRPPSCTPRRPRAWRSACCSAAERAGLETADIALCQAIVTIPIDPKFRSLNLAQAVAINGYEWRATIDAGAPPAFARYGRAGGPGRTRRPL